MSDILKTQRSFARKAATHPEHRFGDLYHLLCRQEWLEVALQHVLANTGARTAGVDGISKSDLRTTAQQTAFVHALQADLKAGTYRPLPVKRVWIPKPGKTEKRGLGIPTIRDRVVQEALRMLLEPIWESDFLDCSHGFRPGHRTMDCIHTFYHRVQWSNKYFWAIEGDIRKCFDRINHHILLRLVRQRVADERVVQLVKAFLQAGLLDGGLFQDTPAGTPQGGILSPLLANIYLHQLDLWWWQRFGRLSPYEKSRRRQAHQGNAILIRYADDFVVLWNGTHQAALQLRDELRQFLAAELHLELSPDKTRVTHLADGLDFLGFHLQWRPARGSYKPWLRVTPTAENIRRFRAQVKALTQRNTTYATPEMRLKTLNRLIRGWGHYYRYVNFCHDAKKLDFWINNRVCLWLQKRHQRKGVRWVLRQYRRRETQGDRNRWNLAAEGRTGEPVFLARLGDIPVRRYFRRRAANPYLTATEVSPATMVEAPLLDPRVVNVPPEEMQWQEARSATLKRDGYRCAHCGQVVAALEVHHVVARQHKGTNDPENLVTLCPACHRQTPTYGKLRRVDRPRESRMTRKCHVRFGGKGAGNTPTAR